MTQPHKNELGYPELEYNCDLSVDRVTTGNHHFDCKKFLRTVILLNARM